MPSLTSELRSHPYQLPALCRRRRWWQIEEGHAAKAGVAIARLISINDDFVEAFVLDRITALKQAWAVGIVQLHVGDGHTVGSNLCADFKVRVVPVRHRAGANG